MESRKRKKTTKTDGAIVDLLEQVITAQSKSDERMISLEEKRLKMEERQLEREVQLRREAREFQMQTMRMMVMGSGVHQPPPSAGGNQRMANHGLTPPPSSFVNGLQEAMDNYYPYTNYNED